jgi:hypothetical protein
MSPRKDLTPGQQDNDLVLCLRVWAAQASAADARASIDATMDA